MRVRLAALFWLAVSILPAAADSRDLVMERLSRCYTIADTRQYLDCFYAAAQPLRAELNLPPAPQAANFVPLFARPATSNAYAPVAPTSVPGPVVASAAPPPEAPRQGGGSGLISDVMSNVMGMKTEKVAPEQFGLRNARPGPGVNVDHITAHMTSYTIDPKTGFFAVVLDNGQVWQQIVGDENSAEWTKPASSYAVTISYGAMGSYTMTVNDERQGYKVRRVK